jgi:hypothetical protein
MSRWPAMAGSPGTIRCTSLPLSWWMAARPWLACTRSSAVPWASKCGMKSLPGFLFRPWERRPPTSQGSPRRSWSAWSAWWTPRPAGRSSRAACAIWRTSGISKSGPGTATAAASTRKGEEFIAQLERLREDSRLYFTQPITGEVIEFVQAHPEIRQGVREGNVLYEAKIPYMAQKYLHEADERLKRYYYCHCPWVRESLKEGDVAVSPTFCLCSAGFHKKAWEVIFEQPLRAEIVETVLQGDPWCKIAIHLPERALEAVSR